MNDNLKTIEGDGPEFRAVVDRLAVEVKAGRIRAVAMVTIGDNGKVDIDWWKSSEVDTTNLIGCVEVLKTDIMKTIST